MVFMQNREQLIIVYRSMENPANELGWYHM